MKKFLIAVGFLFLSKISTAQTAYTDSILNLKTKMQLTDIYIDEVTKLAFASPYTPFTIGVNDSIHGELDIPVSKYLDRKREKILAQSQAFGDTMKAKLYELVPYSDKKDIIRAILFLQETNNEIKVINK